MSSIGDIVLATAKYLNERFEDIPMRVTETSIKVPSRMKNDVDSAILRFLNEQRVHGYVDFSSVKTLGDDVIFLFAKDEKPKYDYSKRSKYADEGYSHLFDTDIASMYPTLIRYSSTIHLRRAASIDNIKKVIFSGPCTIILWCDGTKTIVRCGPDDEFDKEKGIAMCILKKMFGSSHQMSKWMKEQIGEEEEEHGFELPPFFFADDKKIDL